METAANKALRGRDKVLADLQEMGDRLWRARRELIDTNLIYLEREGTFQVFVGNEFWDALLALHPHEDAPVTMLVDRRVVPVDGHEPEWGVFFMGIRVRPDHNLDPRGIAIRAEVIA